MNADEISTLGKHILRCTSPATKVAGELIDPRINIASAELPKTQLREGAQNAEVVPAQ
jgi:hypothetical protein